jgi:plastocyanin
MRVYFRTALTLVVIALITSGCGGGSDSSAPAPSTTAPAAVAAAAPLGSAGITGTISYSGTAPARARIRLDRDCTALHEAPVLAETVIVNENGTLQNVFVYIKEGLGDRTFPVPTEPVVMDQNGCVYTPHVFGIQVGQTLKILNSDPFLHNLHTLPEKNRSANIAMPQQGDEREQTFRVSEVMMKIKCDVHPWMSSYAGILDHSYYSVSNSEGDFTIDELPAGTYTIEAWHEEYGVSTQTVTIADEDLLAIEFVFGEGT